MVDKLETIKYVKDDFGLLCSLEVVHIPFLNTYLEIWCNTFNDEHF